MTEPPAGYTKSFRQKWDATSSYMKLTPEQRNLFDFLVDHAKYADGDDAARGQVRISTRKLARDFGAERMMIRRALTRMESLGMVSLMVSYPPTFGGPTHQPTHPPDPPSTLVTITNYCKFQAGKDEPDPAPRPATRSTSSYKKIKNRDPTDLSARPSLTAIRAKLAATFEAKLREPLLWRGSDYGLLKSLLGIAAEDEILRRWERYLAQPWVRCPSMFGFHKQFQNGSVRLAPVVRPSLWDTARIER